MNRVIVFCFLAIFCSAFQGALTKAICEEGEINLFQCFECICRDGDFECRNICPALPSLIQKRDADGSSSEEDNCKDKDLDRGDCWECKCVHGAVKCNPLCTGDDYQMLECTPGEEFLIDCNSCTCGKDGVPDCTRMGCHSERERHKGILGLVKKELEHRDKRDASSSEEGSCNPHDKVKTSDCWDCKCEHGTVKCNPLCTGDDYEMLECTPGEEFDVECNQCRCADDGGPICTKKGCNSDRERHKGILGLVKKELEGREKRDTS